MKRSRSPGAHDMRAAPPSADARVSRDLGADENADLCAGCVKCCTYITVEIDAPRAAWEYDQWIWALCHRGISLYVEKPEHWFLHVETICTHLDARGRCAIHGRHPVLCRDYDPRGCERRLPLADIRAWFDDGGALEAWLREHRPAHHRRLVDYRRDQPQGAPVADAGRPTAAEPALIAIAGLGAASSAGNGARAPRRDPPARAPRREGRRLR